MKLICCNAEVQLEKLPGNYNHTYEGQCKICKKFYGIEDYTEIMNECSDERKE